MVTTCTETFILYFGGQSDVDIQSHEPVGPPFEEWLLVVGNNQILSIYL